MGGNGSWIRKQLIGWHGHAEVLRSLPVCCACNKTRASCAEYRFACPCHPRKHARIRGLLTHRIIPCLDVKAGRVVKGVNFVQLRDAGDPVEIARQYDAAGADELVFLDITASH